MKRWLPQLVLAGGLAVSCIAIFQIQQLVDGRAIPDLWNYLVTSFTIVSGIGLTSLGILRIGSLKPQPSASHLADQHALVAALDLLFAHFPDDPAAQETVRVVARAVTERRYRADQAKI